MVGLWERREQPRADLLGRHEAPARDRARPAALAARAVPRRADGRARPADAQLDLGLHRASSRRREDITIFLTTHYMDEAEHCDRIAIIDQGQIVALDTPEALKASVGKDRVQIARDDDDAAIAALRERFGLEATIAEGARDVRGRRRRGSSCRGCSPSSACRSVGAASRGRRSTTCSCPTPARRSATPRPSGGTTRCAAMMRGDADDRHDHRDPPRAAPRAGRACASRPRRLARRPARDQDRLAARADPLLARPPADRHLAACSRCCSCSCSAAGCRASPSGGHRGRRPAHVHLPRRAGDGGAVHGDVLGRLDRVGPRVRLPARDARRAGAARLDRDRQVPRRRDRRRLPGR